MTIADDALANALKFEAVKCAYRQTKDGIVVSLVVHPSDVPDGLATAPLGSRYVAVLVQVGDDEKPVKSAEGAQPRQIESKRAAGAKREKREWRDVDPTTQAAMRCAEPAFHRFLEESYADDWQAFEHDPAEVVRFLCGVKSRKDLNVVHAARMIWHALDNEFQLWMKVPV